MSAYSLISFKTLYQYPADVVSSPTSISETGNEELETRIHEEQLKECI